MMPHLISKEVSRMYPVRYIEKVNNLYENIEIMFVYTGGGMLILRLTAL